MGYQTGRQLLCTNKITSYSGDMGFPEQVIRNVHAQVLGRVFNLKGLAVYRILGWDM